MDTIWIIFIGLLGACIGSFLNVVIWRLPRGESIAFPGSHCPSCGRAIKWYDNIPIASWLLLRGRCRFCNVRISPRYLLIELSTAALLVGLYLCYFVWQVRSDGQDQIFDMVLYRYPTFIEDWPSFAAQATLICVLLACTMIDIELFIVPLEICWFASIVGLACSTIWPKPEWVPTVSHPMGAATIGAGVGLIIANILLRKGIILPSFIDADNQGGLVGAEGESPANTKNKAAKSNDESADKKSEKSKYTVAYTKADGVNPRVEILREILFLAPAILGAFLGWAMMTYCPFMAGKWDRLYEMTGGNGGHLDGALASLFGYMIGGGLIWGIRIAGTLGFGKEAMGLGDVHILAATGAVCGWVIPTIAFFVAPFFGLLWAILLLVRRGQRELPYGPWLGLGSLVAMVFYDQLGDLFKGYMQMIR